MKPTEHGNILKCTAVYHSILYIYIYIDIYYNMLQNVVICYITCMYCTYENMYISIHT